MSCQYCKGTGWILYKVDAPSPPYRENHKLEYAKECVCVMQDKKAYNNRPSHDL